MGSHDKFEEDAHIQQKYGKNTNKGVNLKRKNEKQDCISNAKKVLNNTEKSDRGDCSTDSLSREAYSLLLSTFDVKKVDDSTKYNITSAKKSDANKSKKCGVNLALKDNMLEYSTNSSEVECTNYINILKDEGKGTDPFLNHFGNDLSDEMLQAVSSQNPQMNKYVETWPEIGQFVVMLPEVTQEPECKANMALDSEEDKVYATCGTIPRVINEVDWCVLHVKQQISKNICSVNSNLAGTQVSELNPLTTLQKELFSIINSYQDIYYSKRNLRNSEEIRLLYCVHAVNHVLKTRAKIINNNARAMKNQLQVQEELRDQGLVRPKVLILVPFRDSALKVVQIISSILLSEEKGKVSNKKRFLQEFKADEIKAPRKNPRPEDYEMTFSGNTDDTFRIGLTVTKQSLKLYTDFYSADIVVASPLGLRIIIGAEGDTERDYDFLASIELLVLDQTEIFLMQNWDHVLHVLDHLHLQPRESHGTDFSRVRTWALNGWTRYYRQTLLFASHPLPQFAALVSKRCHNYRGKIASISWVPAGTLCEVILQIPQMFHKINVDSVSDAINKRFDFFIKQFLPQYKDSTMSHTLIFVPSYFDFVRLRNHFKREDISFVQICEYSKEGKIARARDKFFHSESLFLLYSERFHFFRRIRVRGIHHIIFYQPPTFPHFYSEMCNFMQEIKGARWANENSSGMTVSILYTKFDTQQVAAIVGSDRTASMLASEKCVHMFMTGQ